MTHARRMIETSPTDPAAETDALVECARYAATTPAFFPRPGEARPKRA